MTEERGDAGLPEAPDGSGPALVLLRPEKNPDHSLGANWRSSGASGGSPAVSDALTYTGWAGANSVTDLIGTDDDEGDGLANLYEYALGLNPKAFSLQPAIAGVQSLNVNNVTANYLTLTFTRPVGRDDVSFSVEASSDLTAAWTATAVLVSSTVNYASSTETLVYRYPLPQTDLAQEFLRLKITRLP